MIVQDKSNRYLYYLSPGLILPLSAGKKGRIKSGGGGDTYLVLNR
jgi:hypothetical protein